MNLENTTFTSPFGELQLQRYPKAPANSPLRAWDAADQYLLEYLHEEEPGLAEKPLSNTPLKNVLILNDQFGALTMALNKHHPTNVTDSYLSQQGLLNNLTDNQMNADHLKLFGNMKDVNGHFDLVVIKVTKTLALLEDQLSLLRNHISRNTTIIACGMVKEVHTSTLQLFEQILGPAKTSLAKKKARLIFCQPEPSTWPPVSAAESYTSPYPSSYTLPENGWLINNHANVFSRAKLDIGTRFFMENIQRLPKASRIIDLGCGNGLLGVLAGDQNPDGHVQFFDESHMALDSAKENAQRILEGRCTLSFTLDNCLSSAPSDSVDLVLNNPPFHQKNVVGDHIAWQMFKDAYRVLSSNGQLWVIGNRHLQYHAKLKRLFGNCQTVASNKKFVLLVATKNNRA